MSEQAHYWIAGATGFLGSHLVKHLEAGGHRFTAVSKRGGSVHGHDVGALDVLNADAVAESAQGADGAFLSIGSVGWGRENADALHRDHVLGTRSALRGLRQAGVRRVVIASTSGTIAVGRDPNRIFDETATAPLEVVAAWPYYRNKLYAEQEALEANGDGLDVVVVNPSLLLGPGDLRESSTGDVRRFLERTIPAVPAGGLAFVDVRDAAKGMLLAMEKGKPGERYLLNAANLTVAAFFSRLERVSGVKAPVLGLPRSKTLALGAHRLFVRAVEAIGGTSPLEELTVELGQHFWYCSADKAERELGWRARDPGETLRDTVDDLVERGVAFPKGGRYDRAS